jgi:tetratricopeptide (TPR) repeat protein
MATAQVPVYAFGKTVAGGVLAIAALFLIDTFLAKTERAESHVEAGRLYQAGQGFMQARQSAQAVEQFRSAVAIDRGNEDYQLALGQALLAAGQSSDAETVLTALTLENPFAGPANLALARAMVHENKIGDAISYYHRAIYGQWKEGAGTNSLQARFELADLLSHQNSKEALLVELLPLQDEAPDDVATQEKIGLWFLAAGSPARAVGVFREILRADPQRSEALAGLGKAEFASGDYRGARDEFQAALRIGPEDPTIRARLDLCTRILDLDPTLRGLRPDERLRRSRTLLESALDDVKQCLGEPASEPAQGVMKSAEGLLQRKTIPYDDNLDLTDQLWQLRQRNCKQTILPSEEPLEIVLSKLSQK